MFNTEFIGKKSNFGNLFILDFEYNKCYYYYYYGESCYYNKFVYNYYYD